MIAYGRLYASDLKARWLLVELCMQLHADFKFPFLRTPLGARLFDTDKSGIDQVCRVLAHLYRLPKAQYIAVSVCKEGESFTNMDSPAQPVPKDGLLNSDDTTTPASVPVNPESGGSKKTLIKAALRKVKVSKESDDETKSLSIEGEAREDVAPKLKEKEKNKVKERDREKERLKVPKRDRGRDSDREHERERVGGLDRSRQLKDIDAGGHSDKSRDHVARDRGDYYDSYSNREKNRHRHQSYSQYYYLLLIVHH